MTLGQKEGGGWTGVLSFCIVGFSITALLHDHHRGTRSDRMPVRVEVDLPSLLGTPPWSLGCRGPRWWVPWGAIGHVDHGVSRVVDFVGASTYTMANFTAMTYHQGGQLTRGGGGLLRVGCVAAAQMGSDFRSHPPLIGSVRASLYWTLLEVE